MGNLFYKIITYRPTFTVRVFAGLFAILISLGVCGAIGISDLAAGALQERDANYSGRLIEAGGRVYSEQCARCHGPEGKGLEGQGPALSSRYFLGDKETPSERLKDIGYGGTIEQYVESVTAGGMPVKSSSTWDVVHPTFSNVYGGPLRPDQVSNVTKFVVNWKLAPYLTGVIDSPKPGTGSGPVAAAVPLTPEEEAGKAVYLGAAGCTACHAVRGVGSQGGVGPALTKIYATAKDRIASDAYKKTGRATTPEDYIRESIISPAAYMVEQCPQGPCPAGVMPANFGQTIKPEDLTNLVKFLSAQGR